MNASVLPLVQTAHNGAYVLLTEERMLPVMERLALSPRRSPIMGSVVRISHGDSDVEPLQY